MSKESIQGPLTALRHAGTVSGVCLTRGQEVVINLFPFSEERINEVVTLVDDIFGFLANQNREVDQMCFGYDGGNLVIVTDDEFRLIVMHMRPDEMDFIAKAARAFLVDFQVGLFAEQLSGGDPRLSSARMVTELPPVVIPGEEPDSLVEPAAPGETAAPEAQQDDPRGSAPADPEIIRSPGVEASHREEAGGLPPKREGSDSGS